MEIGDIQKLVEAVGEQYAPPYDSPIENVFAYHLLKHISPSATLERQVEVDTPVGGFRLDFMLSDEDLSIGLECDGEKFHDPWRDEWRDAMILGTRLVSDILDYNTNRQPPIYPVLNDREKAEPYWLLAVEFLKETKLKAEELDKKNQEYLLKFIKLLQIMLHIKSLHRNFSVRHGETRCLSS